LDWGLGDVWVAHSLWDGGVEGGGDNRHNLYCAGTRRAFRCNKCKSPVPKHPSAFLGDAAPSSAVATIIESEFVTH